MHKKLKTLYVSDLDGTLLRSDETITSFTTTTINGLVDQGMIFSYATARSYNTAHKVTKGLEAKIPLIVYNGAMIVDNKTGAIILANYFEKDDLQEILEDLINSNIYPIVYATYCGAQKFSYVEHLNTRQMQDFLNTRKGDNRSNPVEKVENLSEGDCFYVTCIDHKEKLAPLYKRYKNRFHCIFHEDIYLHSQWLEIMPLNASKSNAVRQLKEFYNCSKVIAFGDGKNDVDMFKMADEAYAVANADEKLKQEATGIIESNNDDGVAKWLSQYYDS